jgi:hypothetical protein
MKYIYSTTKGRSKRCQLGHGADLLLSAGFLNLFYKATFSGRTNLIKWTQVRLLTYTIFLIDGTQNSSRK